VAGSSRPRGFDAIRDERAQALESVRYRLTGGAQGTAPAGHLAAERRSIIGAAAARIMRKASGPASAGQIPKGTGSPLPADVKAKMEPKLGADLSAVRLHTGSESAAAATNFGARAFTVGNDIHFNAGQFAPGTKEGDKLLAHELTHVVQGQSSGIQRKPDESNDASTAQEEGVKDAVSDPDEPAEKEADAVSEKVSEDLHDSTGSRSSKPRSGEVGASASASAHKSDKTTIAAKLEGTARKLFRSAQPGGGAASGGVWLTTVRGDQVIVDANIAISLDRKAKGLALNDAHKRNVAMAEQQGILLTPQVVAELTRGGGGQQSSKPSRGRSSQRRKKQRFGQLSPRSV
jgi:hypothetical protein